MKKKTLLALVGSSALIVAGQHSLASAPTITHDVVFKVGTDASIIWFEIDNPAVRGTLNVTNAPYAATDSLNGAAVDISRNRLLYNDNTNQSSVKGYAINNLSGLQLLQNGATAVTVSPLGTWPVANGSSAGYRNASGGVYYLQDGTDELRYLNFNASGSITGYTSAGNFTGGNGFTSSITGGDIDFDAAGSLWVTGTNSAGTSRLWNFDPTTLQDISAVDDIFLNGMTFDSAGQTLYGYQASTGDYGSINTSSGTFQTVLATNSALFGDSGDLAQGIETIVPVPEPSALGLIAAAALGFLKRRRNGC